MPALNFQLTLAKKETYASIHWHDDFEKVIDNLKTCYRLKNEINPNLKIMVSFIVTKQTENEVELLKEITDSYVDEFITHPVRAFFHQSDLDLSHLKVQGSPTFTIPCSMVFNRIHVTHDGFLTACCVDFNHDLLLADLNTTPLNVAWLSDNAVRLRKKHINNNLEGTMCYGCSKGNYLPYEALRSL